jgi:hypothetical protein
METQEYTSSWKSDKKKGRNKCALENRTQKVMVGKVMNNNAIVIYDVK